MYADNITESMQKTIDETIRRRTKQLKYNEEHHITPKQIVRAIKGTLPAGSEGNTTSQTASIARKTGQAYIEPDNGMLFAADPVITKMSRAQLEKSIENTTALMKQAAKDLDFLQAAQYRDEIIRLQKELETK